MLKIRITILTTFLFSILGSAETVAIAGDSTVATYSSSSAKQGWGASFSKFLTTKLSVKNFAKGGRTTKSFRSEGLWKNLMNAKANFVFIQFAHNDSGSTRHVPLKEYRANLVAFAKEVLAKKGEPYFVTPPHRCRFSNGKPSNEMGEYVNAMKSAAAELDIQVLDLYKKSGEFLQKSGSKACKEYFVSGDTTHFNRKGSEKMASLVAEEAKLDALLAKFIK